MKIIYIFFPSTLLKQEAIKIQEKINFQNKNSGENILSKWCFYISTQIFDFCFQGNILKQKVTLLKHRILRVPVLTNVKWFFCFLVLVTVVYHLSPIDVYGPPMCWIKWWNSLKIKNIIFIQFLTGIQYKYLIAESFDF